MIRQAAVSSKIEASAADETWKQVLNWIDKMLCWQQLLVVYYVSQQYRQRAERELQQRQREQQR